MMIKKERGNRRVLQGVVVGDKMDKTVRVEMVRRYRHPMYKKFVTRRKVFLVHDETNQCGVGDTVQIVESRPLSRAKRWRVQKILAKAI
jgi:small subunit ribosomal protein S17